MSRRSCLCRRVPAPSIETGNGNGHHSLGEETPFQMWKRTNVVTQKQDGYVTAAIKLFMGDITAEQSLFVARFGRPLFQWQSPDHD